MRRTLFVLAIVLVLSLVTACTSSPTPTPVPKVIPTATAVPSQPIAPAPAAAKPAATAAPAKPAEVKPPAMITAVTQEVGTGGYSQLGYFGEALMKQYGTKVRHIPAATDISRLYPVRMKDADFAWHGGGSPFASEGIEDYVGIDWGPQRVRSLWLGEHMGGPLAVRGDSPVKTVADLKGKRSPYYPYAAQTQIQEANHAFAGLTWKDLVRVEVSSITKAQQMVMEGQLDSVQVPPTGASAYEWASMPYGMRYLQLEPPDKNPEGWKRIQAISSRFTYVYRTIGANLSKTNGVHTFTYAYPVALGYDFLSDDKAYFITRAFHETYPTYSKMHEQMEEFFKLDTFINLIKVTPIPLHNGSIKYLKEIGKWTSEFETLQQERVKRQEALIVLFQQVKDEAVDKKIKSSDFPKFWMDKRAAAGYTFN